MSFVKPSSFKQRVLKSSTWTLAGYGMSQALRLGGNIILTRLLFPEAFGLMAIVLALIYGVTMLTDVGIGPSIVQKARGDDPDFLNTAWTVQIIRGILIWAGLTALAWPMSRFYAEPLLASMLPVVGLTAIISGFNSTKLYTAQRNLDAGRFTLIDIGTYAIGLLCTCILAWLQQSVWALVWGNVITTCLKALASHTMLHGIKNKFAWDRDALDHLLGFGRWILLSSTLTFLSVEGLRLLVGAMLDMRQLALYTLASTMSLLFWQALQQLTTNVLFPSYSQIYRDNPKNLLVVLYKARLTLILPSWGLAALFTLFGSEIMGVLYDARYRESGTMLEMIAAGSFVGCVWGSYSGVLLAMGKVATHTLMTAIQIVCLITGILIGYQYAGDMGIVPGIAASNWIMYPASAVVMFKNGLWQPKLDLIFLTASILFVWLKWPNVAMIFST